MTTSKITTYNKHHAIQYNNYSNKINNYCNKIQGKTYRKHVVTSYIQQMHKHQYDDNVDEEELRILSQKKADKQKNTRIVGPDDGWMDRRTFIAFKQKYCILT